MSGAAGFGGYGAYGNTRVDRADFPTSASARRPGTPYSRSGSAPVADEDLSQDAPMISVGARVKHQKFGTGTIAEISGNGRDTKARIDFDDEAVGRKTLVVAQANLERGWD